MLAWAGGILPGWAECRDEMSVPCTFSGQHEKEQTMKWDPTTHEFSFQGVKYHCFMRPKIEDDLVVGEMWAATTSTFSSRIRFYAPTWSSLKLVIKGKLVPEVV